MPFSVLAVPLNAVRRMVSPILGALIYAFCASKNDWPYTALGNLSPSRSAQNPLKLSFTSILYTRPNHNLYTPDPQKKRAGGCRTDNLRPKVHESMYRSRASARVGNTRFPGKGK